MKIKCLPSDGSFRITSLSPQKQVRNALYLERLGTLEDLESGKQKQADVSYPKL
jgi:hypothetical protein